MLAIFPVMGLECVVTLALINKLDGFAACQMALQTIAY